VRRQLIHGWKHHHRAPPASARVRSLSITQKPLALGEERIARVLRRGPSVTVLFAALNEDLVIYCSFLGWCSRRTCKTASRRSLAQGPGRRSSPTSTRSLKPRSEHYGKRFLLRSPPRPAASSTRHVPSCRGTRELHKRSKCVHQKNGRTGTQGIQHECIVSSSLFTQA
jgi:hypothetical protein